MYTKPWKKLFWKKQTKFDESFSEFSKALTLIVDIEPLKDNVISKIHDTVKVDSIMIFLFNPDLNRFELAETRGFDAVKNEQLYFSPDDHVMQWFSVNKTHLNVTENHEVFSYFLPHEQNILKETHINLIFPLLVMNKITGIICLGPKPDGDSYTGVEIELLDTLLGQAALAFENAYLYEQQKTRLRKMYRTDRLATLGQLAAGAAHEIRNPLTSIRSTIQYLHKDFKDETKSGLMAELIEEVDRINDIIEGLLSFSKPGTPQTEQFNLEQLLEQTLSLVTTTAKKRNIDIQFTFHPPENILNADPAQLKQVFLNIIMNALQAMPNGGKLIISVHLKTIEKYIAQQDQSFLIVFKDSGNGIEQEHIDHIFDPFFTTKQDGTGLGLSISYGIIRQHGGDIEIESRTRNEYQNDCGTTVSILIPVKNV